MKRATWSGLDGRVVVRPDRRPREGQPAAPVELTSDPVVPPPPVPTSSESVDD